MSSVVTYPLRLKPCPFCGGKARFRVVGRDKPLKGYYAYCCNEDCLISPRTHSFYFKEQAAEAWNKRCAQ